MKLRWVRVFCALALVLWWGTGKAVAATQTLYLIQNSGWMEPFYSDHNAQFKPLLKAFVAASHPNDDIIVAAFNQDGQLPGKRSPEELYRGPYSDGKVAATIDALTPPVRPDGHLTDADFDGAIENAVNRMLGGRPGIVWMVTNNKNSPNNSQEVNANTRAFAKRLSSATALPYIVAYPIRMRAVGKSGTRENGLIVYGIAYGDEAEAALRECVRSSAMRTLFSDPAAELKSQQNAPLVFVPKNTLTPGIKAMLDGRNGLRLDGIQEDGGSVVINGTLRSEYFPLMIERADTSVHWASLAGTSGLDSLPVTIDPNTIHNLAPQNDTPNITLTITVPKMKRPSGLAGLFKSEQYVTGTLVFDLSNLTLTMQEEFKAKLKTIAALDQLPDVFFDYQRVKEAKTTIPIVLRIHYSPWPLILAVGLLFLLLLAIIVGIVATMRDREYKVQVGSSQQRIRLRAFETKTFKLPDGSEISFTGMPFGPCRTHTKAAPKTAETPSGNAARRRPALRRDTNKH